MLECGVGGGAGRTDLREVTVGTRGSRLALRQTDILVGRLRATYPNLNVTVVRLRTPGDEFADRPVASIGDKGVFVRPLERALLAGEIDIAVHSLKDVPADVEISGLVLAAFPEREDPRDALVSPAGHVLDELPRESRVGTSSLRRRTLLNDVRPDLRVIAIRGNVDTRLAKLDTGQYDALVLAAAGLVRLGLHDCITQYLPLEPFLPDPGQGILAVQTRREDPVEDLVACLDDPAVRIAALAERGVARGLGADCQSPVAAFAAISVDGLHVRAMAAPDDGGPPVRGEILGPPGDAAKLGEQLGRGLKERLYTER